MRSQCQEDHPSHPPKDGVPLYLETCMQNIADLSLCTSCLSEILFTKTYFNVQRPLYCIRIRSEDWHVFSPFFLSYYPHTYLPATNQRAKPVKSTHLLLLLTCNFCPVKYWICVCVHYVTLHCIPTGILSALLSKSSLSLTHIKAGRVMPSYPIQINPGLHVFIRLSTNQSWVLVLLAAALTKPPHTFTTGMKYAEHECLAIT